MPALRSAYACFTASSGGGGDGGGSGGGGTGGGTGLGIGAGIGCGLEPSCPAVPRTPASAATWTDRFSFLRAALPRRGDVLGLRCVGERPVDLLVQVGEVGRHLEQLLAVLELAVPAVAAPRRSSP